MDLELKLSTDTVGQAAPSTPLCVTPETTLRVVFDLMRQHRSSSVVVCRGEELVGIFTERDALRLMAQWSDDARSNGDVTLDTPVGQIMVRSPISVREDAAIGSAILRMSTGGYRRLPIVDTQNRPVGVVQVAGIMHYIVEHFPKTVYNLPPVAHPVMHEREGP